MREVIGRISWPERSAAASGREINREVASSGENCHGTEGGSVVMFPFGGSLCTSSAGPSGKHYQCERAKKAEIRGALA